MPIDYWSILKRSYQVTIRYPGLWLLGLLLAGGFNANFFYWANLRLGWRDKWVVFLFWLGQRAHSTQVAVGLIILCVAGAALIIVVNWAKIIFILRVSDILQLQRMRPGTQDSEESLNFWQASIQESFRYVVPVVAMSIFTMVSMGVVTAILAGAPQWLFASHGLVWLLAAAFFLALVFFFSCLNIFGSFFIIFYRRSFASALNLAFDLIVSRWRVILGMAVLLMLIYGLCFFVGTALLSVFIIPSIGGAVLWAWLAIVNTFFNISLLLLFVQLVRPPYHPEFKTLMEQLPSVLPGQAAS